MNTKIDVLKKQIYSDCVNGKYGIPHIPSIAEVESKIKELTAYDYNPVIKNINDTALNIGNIRSKFSSVITDLRVLYNSIEKQSTNILNQLTASLKENNGVKREFSRIAQLANDVASFKAGKEYLMYTFTESFNNLDFINVGKSSNSIDTKTGKAYISPSALNLVDLSHYYNRKIDIRNSNYRGTIVSSGFVSHANASVIFDRNNDNRLHYRVIMSQPTELHSSFVIQLDASNIEKEINAVNIDIDSANSKGICRIQYRQDGSWKDISTVTLTNIKSDNIQFKFAALKTTSIKLIFIKEMPDVFDKNQYDIIIKGIEIYNESSSRVSSIYSKAIEFGGGETISSIYNLMVSADAYIPDGCAVNVKVAKDKLIPGYFVDSDHNYVLPKSLNAIDFVIDSKYDIANAYKYVFLSDIIETAQICNLDININDEFEWTQVDAFNSKSNTPKVVKVSGGKTKALYDNTLYNDKKILVGDSFYKSGYPQNNPDGDLREDIVGDWFFEGLINNNTSSSNLQAYIEPNTVDGLDWNIPNNTNYSIITRDDDNDPSTITIDDTNNPDNLLGIPLNWYNYDAGRTGYLNDTHVSMSGWWRPDVGIVTPSGLEKDNDGIAYPVSKDKPDFIFNGINFYKIYKISGSEKVIPQSINLYQYPQIPVTTDDNHFPHKLKWSFVKSKKFKDVSESFKIRKILVGEEPNQQTNYVVDIKLLYETKYINKSVRNVRLSSNGISLTEDIHYIVESDGINLPLYSNIVSDSGELFYSEHLLRLNFTKGQRDYNAIGIDEDSSIDVVYTYEYIDDMLSTWSGYVINDRVDSVIRLDNKKNEIGKIILTNVDTNETYIDDIQDKIENYTYKFKQLGTFKINIHCKADSNGMPLWNPYEELVVERDIRLVQDYKPLRIVSFDNLLYNTLYSNDSKCSIIVEQDGYSYVVVKEPCIDSLKGYYFSELGYVEIGKDENYVKPYAENGWTFVDSDINYDGLPVVPEDYENRNVDRYHEGLLNVTTDNSIIRFESNWQIVQVVLYSDRDEAPLIVYDKKTMYTDYIHNVNDVVIPTAGKYTIRIYHRPFDLNWDDNQIWANHNWYPWYHSQTHIGISYVSPGVTIANTHGFDLKENNIYEYNKMHDFRRYINKRYDGNNTPIIETINYITGSYANDELLPIMYDKKESHVSYGWRTYNVWNQDSITKIWYTYEEHVYSVVHVSPSTVVNDVKWNNSSVWPSSIQSLKYASNRVKYPYNSTRHNRIITPSYEILFNNVCHEGFSSLFYNTAENLSSYYSISYTYSNKNDNSDNRFLYSVELSSDSSSTTPLLYSLKFTSNVEV